MVIYEGFSDVDSDVAIALEKENNRGEFGNNLLDDGTENSQSFSINMSRSVSAASHAKGSRHSKILRKGAPAVMSKKRKRNDTQEDFLVRQAHAKTEA